MSEREIPLRLHHIKHVAEAMEVGSDIEAKNMLTGAKSDCNSHREAHGSGYARDRDYYLDIIGRLPNPKESDLDYATSREEHAYMGRLRSAFDRYLALPDNTLLRLHAEGSDWICEATCFQNHCTLKDLFTRTEEQIAYRLKKFMAVKQISGDIYIKDHHKGRSFHAITTMGTIRKIIRSTNTEVIGKLMWFLPGDDLNQI